MKEKCDHCGEYLGVSVIWDHGQRYHPNCYPIAFEEKMRKMVDKTIKSNDDWSKGKYET